ncbi:MAG: helix-turn-helix domain-containing protein [Pseudonocardia sp.]|nr:helix-turn-helix domain-containing protein [Pseudonocardia sp.]
MVQDGSRSAGARLREARVARGLSLRDLARSLDVSAATLSQIENDRTRLSIERLEAIADVMGISARDILERRNSRARLTVLRPVEPAGPGSWRSYPRLELGPILDAVLAEFLDVGYHGATVRRIAERSGLSLSGVYHHLSSKQEMLEKLIEVTMADLDWRARAARDEGETPVDRFCLQVENLALFHTYRREPSFVASTEKRSLEPRNRERLASLRTRLQRTIDADVGAAVRAGEFRTDRPFDAARGVVTMCMALAEWFRTDGPLTPEQIARQYVGFALDMLDRRVGPG